MDCRNENSADKKIQKKYNLKGMRSAHLLLFFYMHKSLVSIVFSALMTFVLFTASALPSATPDTVINSISTDTLSLKLNQPKMLLSISLPVTDNPKKKKWVAALFAFPFPFGFVASHRVMLGTKPWIPIVYVATFGGCFGLLPLIDFCVILTCKDIEKYENNPNLFMWIK